MFDELMGEFLQSLKDHGLDDQVLIVVTGDHGFRMRTEFESVGLQAEHGDVAFNVPFLLYGPGLFEKQIRLPYVTSHVDIAPTLLALSGIQDDSWLHHGTHMLDQRLSERVDVHDEHKSVTSQRIPLERLSLHPQRFDREGAGA